MSQPSVGLVSVGNNGAAIDLAVDFLNVIQQIHHGQEVHNAILTDNGT